jgi:hypothetical protein
MEIKCPHCNQSIQIDTSLASNALRIGNVSKHNCEWCGVEFEGAKKAKFCSSSCIHKAKRARQSVVKICAFCSKQFSGMPASKYCSRDCAGKGRVAK